jgi:hypothetical protein
MDAFNKVPLKMRERLASLTGGQTRLLGGSVDTLYIPNRLRKDFMEVLALFLETDCFMEIATPTAVHLVLPREEQILFVDHVSQQSLEFYLLILIGFLSGGHGSPHSMQHLCDKNGYKGLKWTHFIGSIGGVRDQMDRGGGIMTTLRMFVCSCRNLQSDNKLNFLNNSKLVRWLLFTMSEHALSLIPLETLPSFSPNASE